MAFAMGSKRKKIEKMCMKKLPKELWMDIDQDMPCSYSMQYLKYSKVETINIYCYYDSVKLY